MPVSTRTPEQRKQQTIPASRQRRFDAARRAISKLVSDQGVLRLTDEQFAELRALIPQDKK